MREKLPWLTLALLAIAIASQALESGALWQLRRPELPSGELLRAEPWRFWTAHLSHWSWQHLLWDGAMFALLGGALESRGRRSYALLLAIAAPTISLGLLFLHPEMGQYRGLSGLDSTLFIAWVLSMFNHARRQGSPWRWLWVAALACFFLKTGWELTSGLPLFVDPQGLFVVLPAAHLLGGGLGLLHVFSSRLGGSRRSAPPCPRSRPRLSTSHH